MELDLQRFYNINRRVLMWIAFFGILYLLRDFFAVMFLTFIFGFVMRKIAGFIAATTRVPYWSAVIVPYLVVLTLIVLLITVALPRVMEEGVQFSRSVPALLRTVAGEIASAADRYGMAPALANYLHGPESTPLPEAPAPRASADAPGAGEDAPGDAAVRAIDLDLLTRRLQEMLFRFLPAGEGEEIDRQSLPDLLIRWVQQVVGGSLQFLLAVLLSFLIVLDYDRLTRELEQWRQSPVGRFFQEAAASVVEFSAVVGTAFQCQLLIALLNAVITCAGLFLLGIQPLFLLTTIVFLFGMIPVLGVFISSVPILLISFNAHGLKHALMTLGMIIIVHLLEAYVFNPRIYAARFHLNPVIVLIILLVAHETFGVWGMLLGIPVTHYVLNIAQVPEMPRRRLGRLNRLRKQGAREPKPDEA